MGTPTVFEDLFLVNDGTAAIGGQSQAQIVGLADGGFVVAWVEEADGLIGVAPGTDIIARIYDAEGNVVVDSFQLNTSLVQDDEGDFDLTATADGFAIAYVDDAIADTSTRIVYQSYDLTGTPIVSGQVRFTSGTSGARLDNPQIAANLTASNDDVYVAYDDFNSIDEDIAAVIIDETGTFGTPFDSAQNSPDFDRLGDVAILSNGTYVTVYLEDDSSGSNGTQGVEFAIRTETGTAVVFSQNVTSLGVLAAEPQVASLAGGGFVLVYTVGNDIRAIVLSNTGGVILPEFTVAGGANAQNEPHVVGLPDGKFVVIWDDDTAGTLAGQSFNADGSLDGSNFVISSIGGGITRPDISVTADGRILITHDTIGGEILAAIYDPRDEDINPDLYATETTNFLTTDTIVTGKTGSNVLSSTTGLKTILGQEGNDTIAASLLGGDTIRGGAGNDFIIGTLTRREDYDGGLGDDTLDLSDITFGYSLDLETGLTDAASESFTGFENLFSGSGHDTLFGTSADNFIDARAGDNRIEGRAGNDVLIGEDGDDFLSGGDGDDQLIGEGGSNTIEGGAGDDTIFSDGGDDTITGGAGNDFINASSGLNDIDGGGGNDTILAFGFDLVRAGAGNDSVLASTGIGQFVDGGDGLDTLDVALFAGGYVVDLASGQTNVGGEVFINFESIELGAGNDEAFGTAGTNDMSGGSGDDRLLGFGGDDTLGGEGGADTLNGGDGDDLIDGGDGNDQVFAGTGNDTIEGGDGADLLEGQLGNDEINGGAGNDTLRASDGNDVVRGGDGDDVAFGGNDNDTLTGGAGNDTLDGSGGDDVVNGGAGNDVLVGETGDDDIFGDTGNDTIRGGGGDDDIDGWEGDDVIFGASGEDFIRGYDGNDLIEGNQQADLLFGENGRDTLRGGDGFDSLSGGDGDDTLSGGNGNDTLSGDEGIDVLRGNAQNDTFAFASVSESGFGTSDLIDGIEGVGVAGGDVIDLSSIDADVAAAGNTAFNFIGEATTAVAVGLGAGTLWVENSGGQTLLRGIVDNNTGIDFEVRIADGVVDASDYIAGDFIL